MMLMLAFSVNLIAIIEAELLHVDGSRLSLLPHVV